MVQELVCGHISFRPGAEPVQRAKQDDDGLYAQQPMNWRERTGCGYGRSVGISFGLHHKHAFLYGRIPAVDER